MNATDLFLAMNSAIRRGNVQRTVVDAASPNQGPTIEATPGQCFELRSHILNVPGCRRTDLRWALANVLHFFADTENATALRQYNRHSDKYLTKHGDEYVWHGAYGKIAMDQVRRCCWMLRQEPSTRRAVVSMGGCETVDINRPACWSFLHFLKSNGCLDLVVYQRSLSLFGVMPYDCVLLTNVLRFVAVNSGIPAGSLRWCVGSLHCKVSDELSTFAEDSVLLPIDVLNDPNKCMVALNDPRAVKMGRYTQWLLKDEVHT